MGGGEVEKGLAGAGEETKEVEGFLAEDHAFGGGAEVVAAAGDVEVGGGSTDGGDELGFEVEVVRGEGGVGEVAGVCGLESAGDVADEGRREEAGLGEDDDLGFVLLDEEAIEAGVGGVGGLRE
jgi:hypothetical protein